MSTGMIDQGMYDAVEVTRLVGHSVEWVVGLSTDSTHGPAPVPPSFERMFSFLDLISLDFAALLSLRLNLCGRQAGVFLEDEVGCFCGECSHLGE